MDDLKSKLIDKSIEAFILGLEIYNKPTIKYRIEGSVSLSVMRGS